MNSPLALHQQTLLLIAVLCSIAQLPAQFQHLNWDKVYGASGWDELTGIVPLSDGYMLSGRTLSTNRTVFNNDTTYDYHIVRIDQAGKELWNKSFGGHLRDMGENLIQTADGNFIIVGSSESGVGPTKSESSRGFADYWIVKFDPQGNIIWDKTYGGSGWDAAYSVREAKNGDLLVFGESRSDISADKSEPLIGFSDAWLLCLAADGNLKWQKTLGGDLNELGYDLVISNDQRFVYVAGGTGSTPGSGNVGNDQKRGGVDMWCVKLELANQNIVWSRRFGGGGLGRRSYAYRIILSYDDNLILGGYSNSPNSSPSASNNGKDAPNQGGFANDNPDYWVIKITPDGQKIPGYDLSYGGSGLDVCYGLYENFFGDLFVAGVSDSPSNGNKLTEPFGKYDIWVVCLDRNWKERSQKSFGSDSWETLTRIVGNKDGSIVLAGHSSSNKGGTKTENCLGNNDMYVIAALCDVSDGIVNEGEPEPCIAQTITLSAGADTCSTCVYFWSMGTNPNQSNGPLLELPPGFQDSVYLLVARRDGCLMRDSIFGDNPLPPTIDLGPRDTTVTKGESLTIGANAPNLSYLWGTGETSATIVVNYSGVYAVTVTDANGCTASDWIRVYEADKEAVYIPNVFKPDFDGNNDYFNVYCDHSVERIKTLEVFDRWGALVFSKSDYAPNFETDGWDGTHRGRRMPPAAYKYVAVVKFIDGTEKLFHGMVALVR